MQMTYFFMVIWNAMVVVQCQVQFLSFFVLVSIFKYVSAYNVLFSN